MSPKHYLVILCASLILIAVIASGCMSTPATTPPVSSELKKFNSTAEIEQYIKDSMATTPQEGYYRTLVPATGISTDSNAPQRSGEKASIGIPVPMSAGVDYSQTNIQVAGVDEPDIIKNDNRYIYTISGPTLAIIDAYPAAGASVISRTEITDTPKDIFVRGDRLVLFSTGTESTETGTQPQSA
jgi:uncharacterized secreted protein with C-terminal beta-propeller domain